MDLKSGRAEYCLRLTNREGTVMLEPYEEKDDAIILEFKVHDPDDEETLSDTVAAALLQIENKRYAQTLIDKGIPRERIRRYGFAFEGKRVLIG